MGALRARTPGALPPLPSSGGTGILVLVALLLSVAPHDAKLVAGRLAGAQAIGSLPIPRFVRPTASIPSEHLQPLGHVHLEQADGDPFFTHSYTYHDEDGRNVTFTYEVEHRSEATVFALDHMDEVVRFVVKHDPYAEEIKTAELVLENSKSALAWKAALSSEHAFLSGGTHWGHLHPTTNEPETVFFLVTRATVSPLHVDTLELELEQAHFVDVFKTADVRMNLMHARNDLEHHTDVPDVPINFEATENTQPGQNPTHIEPRSFVDDHPAARQLKGAGAKKIFNVVQEIGTFIKKGLTVVKDIAAITKNIITFAEFVVDALNGDVELNEKVDISLFSVNYDKDSESSVCEISLSHVLNGQRDLPIGEIEGKVEMAGTCHDCYAYTGLSTNVHIKISDFELKRAAVWAEGLLNFKYEFSMEFSGEGKYAASKKMFTYVIPRTTVIIAGVSCHTSGQVPIHIGADGVLNAAVKMEGLYKIKASVKLGFEYLHTKGVQMINKMELTHEGNGIVPVQVSGHLGMQIYLWPTVQLVFNNIGGPIFSIKSYLEGILDVENELAGTDANGGKCFAQADFKAAAGVIGSLGAHVRIKVAKKTLFEKKIDPVGLISLKKNIFKGNWKQAGNACKASSNGRKILNLNDDLTAPDELVSSLLVPQLLTPVGDGRPVASRNARRLLADVPTFPTNITGTCKSLGERTCLSSPGCGWCIHGVYCSILPNARGGCDGTHTTGYGEPEYKTYIIRSGEKALNYASTCIKDEYPAYCDYGDKPWFSAAMADGQAALGTSWAKVGTLLDGNMYPDYMDVFGQVLTDVDNLGSLEIAFSFNVGSDHIATGDGKESYSAVTQVRYEGVVSNAKGVNFWLLKSTIKSQDSSDKYDIFYQGSSRAQKYEIPDSYGYVYPEKDGTLRMDIFDTYLCTRTSLTSTNVPLSTLTSINTGTEGYAFSSGRRLQATKTKIWSDSAIKLTCPWGQISITKKTCCRVCRKGKACGHTCIAKSKTCSSADEGCACDSSDVVNVVAASPPGTSGSEPASSTPPDEENENTKQKTGASGSDSTTSTPPAGDNPKTACFPSDSLVAIRDDLYPRKIQDLKHGDIIMTHNASDGASFEHNPVHTITHHDKHAVFTGMKLRSRTGHIIKLSRHHLILVCGSSDIMEGDPANSLSKCALKPAHTVSVGDYLVTVSNTTTGTGNTNLKGLSYVEEVVEETMYGLFNLHAGTSGEPLIVVNGILVSERTDLHGVGGLSADEQNGLLLLSHAASVLLPSAVKSHMDANFARYQFFASLSDEKKRIVKHVGKNVHKLSAAGSKRVTLATLIQNGYALFRHIIIA